MQPHRLVFLNCVGTESINFKDPELVYLRSFETNQQQQP